MVNNSSQQTHQIIRRLRKQLTAALLELDKLEEMIDQPAPEPAPNSSRRGNKYQQQIAINESTGSWRKPAELRKKGKGGTRRKGSK